MYLNIPSDIRAEIINNYLGAVKKELIFRGNHKRNAYQDILSILRDDNVWKIELSKYGLYDILPEQLFHPIDRFDNIPANEYKERFEEEVEQQRVEEDNARTFFSLYDKFIFDLSSAVSQLKEREYSDNHLLIDIICDRLPEKYSSNKFVSHIKEFTPHCKSIRGNASMITFMLRKVLADEGLRLVECNGRIEFEDKDPRYNYKLNNGENARTLCGDSDDWYLGSCYDEDVLYYDVHYWNDDFCDESFLKTVSEIRVFEDFVNDFFMGVETAVHFNIYALAMPVRLSDELCCNYLDYNTNL